MARSGSDVIAVRVLSDCSADAISNAVLSKGVEGYQYVASHVMHPRCCLDVNDLLRQAIELAGERRDNERLPKDIIDKVLSPVGVPDITMTPNFWRSFVIGLISPWIDPDSEDPYIRQLSEKALFDELDYFKYLNLTAVLVRLRGPRHGNLARLIYGHIRRHPIQHYAIWAVVPVVAESNEGQSTCELIRAQNGEPTIGNIENATAVNGEVLPNESEMVSSSNVDSTDPWHWFYEFRTACNRDHNIGLCIEFTPNLKHVLRWSEIARWKGEPLRALLFNTETFNTDDTSGLPVLPKAHQELAKELFIMKPHAIIDGPQLHSRQTELPEGSRRQSNAQAAKSVNALCVYYESLNGIYKERSPPDPVAQFAQGYEDYLQVPLQPLGDNLESQIYETFERDPIKYKEYARAFETALREKGNACPLKRYSYQTSWSIRNQMDDYLALQLEPLADDLLCETYDVFEKDNIKYDQYAKAANHIIARLVWSGKNFSKKQPLVVMVLGAGRGPLVTECYNVIKNNRVKAFKLYAVEKNPNAIVTLNTKRAVEWNNEVDVVFTDMRDFHPEHKADIIVSELLGSFGDNELSPECLDGALHLMKDDGVSIPWSYSSFIGPIHSPKLYNAIREASERDRAPKSSFETGYVVRVVNRFEISRPQFLFKFDHPNWRMLSNDRFKELTFIARESAEIMGFVGYFSAELFGEGRISISILPETHTPGLFSWFPILFPIKEPVYVEKGGTIRLKFWRCSNEQKVWYEWQLVAPVMTPIMNVCGKSYYMRLK